MTTFSHVAFLLSVLTTGCALGDLGKSDEQFFGKKNVRRLDYYKGKHCEALMPFSSENDIRLEFRNFDPDIRKTVDVQVVGVSKVKGIQEDWGKYTLKPGLIKAQWIALTSTNKSAIELRGQEGHPANLAVAYRYRDEKFIGQPLKVEQLSPPKYEMLTCK